MRTVRLMDACLQSVVAISGNRYNLSEFFAERTQISLFPS
jgi:hypothetical protein